MWQKPWPVFLFISILSCISGTAQSSRDYIAFDGEASSYYEKILQLDFNSIESILEHLERSHPNKAYLLLANEMDFYTLFLYERREDFNKRKTNRERRIKILESSKIDPEWKAFVHAEIDLQWALIYFKMGEYLRAVQLLRSSKLLLEEKSKQYPEFPYYHKSLGILKALLGTIPSEFQWATDLLGLDGDIYKGKQELLSFIHYARDKDSFFLMEAQTAMSFLICYLENKPKEAYAYWVRAMGNRDPEPLLAWAQCKIGLRALYNDAVLNVLRALPSERMDRLPYLHFMMGLASLQKLDVKADRHFIRFLSLQGKGNYVKEAWQKRAWNALLKNDEAAFRLHQSQCLIQGQLISDEDEQAYVDAKSGIRPDTLLLKARLLCDGGYTEKALNLLKDKEGVYVGKPDLEMEYWYRSGRLLQLANVPDEALKKFEKTLDINPNSPSYFRCNALLQTGLIYEKGGQTDLARRYFKKCLETNPDRYRKSLHQKAKAGLNRLASK